MQATTASTGSRELLPQGDELAAHAPPRPSPVSHTADTMLLGASSAQGAADSNGEAGDAAQQDDAQRRIASAAQALAFILFLAGLALVVWAHFEWRRSSSAFEDEKALIQSDFDAAKRRADGLPTDTGRRLPGGPDPDIPTRASGGPPGSPSIPDASGASETVGDVVCACGGPRDDKSLLRWYCCPLLCCCLAFATNVQACECCRRCYVATNAYYQSGFRSINSLPGVARMIGLDQGIVLRLLRGF